MEIADSVAPKQSEVTSPRLRWAAPETLLILALFFLFAGSPPADVNEAHYLAKAKHYWNPDWCAGDHFLESADAHLVFNWTFGWLTLLLPLPAVAWIGRLVTWSLLAWSWQRLSFAVLPRKLFSVLSAGLFLLFIQRCHMAGEWIVGGVEAKGFAYVLALLGMEALVRGRWRAVWLLLGAASAFHVLVGGWAVVATIFAWLLSGKSRLGLIRMLPWMLGGFVLSLPGLVPAIALTWGVDPSVVEHANYLYLRRLGHHLVFLWFNTVLILLHFNLVIFWLTVCSAVRTEPGMKRLNLFIGGGVLIAVAGMAIDHLTAAYPAIGASLLRFYWFRPTDAFVPMGAALMTTIIVARLCELRPKLGHWLTFATIALVGLSLGETCYRRWQQEFRPLADEQTHTHDPKRYWNDKTFAAWVEACHWIRDNTDPTALFITPRHQQTFKWYAGRSEIVSRKDIPQNAIDIVQWDARRKKINRAIRIGKPALLELANEFGARYVVWDRRQMRPLTLPRLYPPDPTANAPYEVYWIPPMTNDQ